MKNEFKNNGQAEPLDSRMSPKERAYCVKLFSSDSGNACMELEERMRALVHDQKLHGGRG